MKFTLGMAVVGDYPGAYATTQAARLYHSDYIDDIIIVSNESDSQHHRDITNFGPKANRDGARVKVVHLPDPRGTAPPRNEAVKHAKNEYVIMVDAHVFLAPGAPAALAAFITERGGTDDLIQGPMLSSNLVDYQTHWEDNWRGGMRGTWARTHMSPSGVLFLADRGPAGYWTFRAHDTGSPVKGADIGMPDDISNFDLPENHGARDAADPFPIFAQGLGLYAFKRDSWLGFNDKFRGFGGEEGYIHDKYRAAGRQCWCLPALKWDHRFGRGGPSPYADILTTANKITNYALGYAELNKTDERFRHHFVVDGFDMNGKRFRVPGDKFDALCTGAACTQCMVNAIAIANDIPLPTPTKPAGAPAKASPRSLVAAARSLDDVYANLVAVPTCETCKLSPTIREFCDNRSVIEIGTPRAFTTIPAAFGASYRYVGNVRPSILLMLSTMGRTVEADHETADTVVTGVDTIDRAPALSERYIVAYGTTADNDARDAVRAFVRANHEYTVIRHEQSFGGLIVLSKHSDDKVKPPGAMTKASNATKALFRFVSSGMRTADAQRVELRLLECDTCPSRNGDVCGECGCPVARKAQLESEQCPLKKW